MLFLELLVLVFVFEKLTASDRQGQRGQQYYYAKATHKGLPSGYWCRVRSVHIRERTEKIRADLAEVLNELGAGDRVSPMNFHIDSTTGQRVQPM